MRVTRAFVVGILLLLPVAAVAQQSAEINGKVFDPDGLALPGATVTVANTGTGLTRSVTSGWKMQLAGLQETLTVTGESPLVERTSNVIGATLSEREMEEVPSNFRNFIALTALVPGITPSPTTSSFEGGTVSANGSPSNANVYLIDGMYNND